MAEIVDYALRAESEIRPEQQYLEQRLAQIERGLGRVSAHLGAPAPLTQPLDALHRARELARDLHEQVSVRPLDVAIDTRLEWLDRAASRRQTETDDPLPGLARIALDRRLLEEIRRGWREKRG